MKNPISRTAYYTLAVRAWDAEQAKPVCGDSFAKLFMNDEAQQVWAEFKDETRPNASNAARHAIIDRYLQDELARSPQALVIIIGAGFDTRAFRIKGGRWIEVDDSSIIALKDSILPPAENTNSLTRLPIDFATESLDQKLSAFATPEKTHIVVEGVLMYLNDGQRQNLVTTLQELFPDHIVYCDLMRQSFFEKYSKRLHEKINALGASFVDIREHPERIFLEHGYKLRSSASVPLYATEHGNLGLPAFMVRYFLRTLRDGYCIWRFTFN
jgi:methyltransferase (TIGR00027 family)